MCSEQRTQALREARDEQGASEAERCGVAADLRDRICDLGQRICDIAQRDPGAADTALKCQRSADACSDARYRVGQACGAGR